MGLTFGILRSRTSQDCYDEIMTSRRAKGAAATSFKSKIGVQATACSFGSLPAAAKARVGPDI
jgi:hypothetical protein